MKIIFFLCIMATGISLLPTEPVIDSGLSLSPYDRCMQSFENSERETECEVLK